MRQQSACLVELINTVNDAAAAGTPLAVAVPEPRSLHELQIQSRRVVDDRHHAVSVDSGGLYYAGCWRRIRPCRLVRAIAYLHDHATRAQRCAESVGGDPRR